MSRLNLVRLLLGLTVASAAGCGGSETTPNLPDGQVAFVGLSGVPDSGRLYVGFPAHLVATTYGPDHEVVTGVAVTWSSSNPAVAEVEGHDQSATVWGRGAGSATIVATSEGAKATARFNVVVVPPVQVDTVLVKPDSAALYVAMQLQLTASVLGPYGLPLEGHAVTWRSSDSRVATVSTDGLVTATGAGTVVIRATSEGHAGDASLRILARPTANWSEVDEEWSTFQGNARHTGYVPATADPVVFARRWDASPVPAGTGIWDAVAGAGLLYVTSTAYYAPQTVAALDEATGSIRWSHDMGTIQSLGPPAYGDGAVFVFAGGTDSYLWGYEASSGAQRFQAPGYERGVSYSPVVVGQTLYTSGTFDILLALSTRDGATRWADTLGFSNALLPAVRDGRTYVYASGNDAKVTVSDAGTGARLYDIPDPGFLLAGWGGRGVPVLGGANNLVVTQNNRMVSFDLANRRMAWEVAGVAFRDQVTVANGVLYVHTTDRVEARRESDGTLLWFWTPPSNEEPAGNMIATKNLLFVACGGRTVVLDLAAHTEVWSYPATGRLALTRSGLLLISQASGRLVAVTLK